MEFHSILYKNGSSTLPEENIRVPDFFTDLNMDQIVNKILEGKEEYNLNVYFYHSLKNISDINYRLEVMKELENPDVYNAVSSFSVQMKKVREYAEYSRTLHYQAQREKWLLDAAEVYCNAVINFGKFLNSTCLKSTGFELFRSWLNNYTGSEGFKLLCTETFELLDRFSKIDYRIRVARDKVVIDFEENHFDYCEFINKTFEKINEDTFNYEISFYKDIKMCPLESSILAIILKKNIKLFNELSAYNSKHKGFVDGILLNFDREVQFYTSYITYISKFKNKGFSFAYPDVTTSKGIKLSGMYDLALAYKALASGAAVVCNDLHLDKEERIYILTGPNQGGKTTFARALGQIFFLTSLGCPVPCRNAGLFVQDNIYTHFSAEENISTDTGKLKEELLRLKEILSKATSGSVIILNELFATTTTYDAYTMGKKILEHFINLDCICLYVTHIHELSKISGKTVSLVASIDSENGAARTYKILRKPADGNSYANSIAEKYNLSYSRIKERLDD